MKTIQRFRYLDDFYLAKAFLESHGVRCFGPDENTVRLQWFYCQALGDLRLQTFDEDAAEAAELLRAHHSGGWRPACPKCGSLELVRERFGKWNALTFLLQGFVAIPHHDRFSCRSCSLRIPTIEVGLPAEVETDLEKEALSQPFVDVPSKRLPDFVHFMGGIFVGALVVTLLLPLHLVVLNPVDGFKVSHAYLTATMGGGIVAWAMARSTEIRERAFGAGG